MAKEAATLDLLSDGRLEMGIGAGWSEVEYTAMGLDFEPPGRRIAKLAEVVSFIKAHWQGEELNWAGEFVRVHGYAGRPRPVQRPHPPIMIGGGGQRVLSLAGREADIVSISSVPFVARDADGLDPQAVAQRRIGFVRDAAGERFGDLDVESSPYFTEITDYPETALADLAKSTGIPSNCCATIPTSWSARWKALWKHCVRAGKRWASTTSRSSSPRSDPSHRWWPGCTDAEP